MIKNKPLNPENSLQTTNSKEHNDRQTKGVYLRDDHCDWGSSGMNEFTEEFEENK